MARSRAASYRKETIMANTCYTSIRIAGAPAELQAMAAQMAEALTIPDSGNEKWIGNLWLHMDLDPDDASGGKLGECDAEVTGHEYRHGVLHVETESEGHPQLKALDDFMRRYAPSGQMLFFASEPDTDIHVTNGADGDYASVLFDYGIDSKDPKARELDGWTSVWEQSDLIREMALKLGMDEAEGFDAVAKAFMAAYPVRVRAYAHADIGQYLK